MKARSKQSRKGTRNAVKRTKAPKKPGPSRRVEYVRPGLTKIRYPDRVLTISFPETEQQYRTKIAKGGNSAPQRKAWKKIPKAERLTRLAQVRKTKKRHRHHISPRDVLSMDTTRIRSHRPPTALVIYLLGVFGIILVEPKFGSVPWPARIIVGVTLAVTFFVFCSGLVSRQYHDCDLTEGPPTIRARILLAATLALYWLSVLIAYIYNGMWSNSNVTALLVYMLIGALAAMQGKGMERVGWTAHKILQWS